MLIKLEDGSIVSLYIFAQCYLVQVVCTVGAHPITAEEIRRHHMSFRYIVNDDVDASQAADSAIDELEDVLEFGNVGCELCDLSS